MKTTWKIINELTNANIKVPTCTEFKVGNSPTSPPMSIGSCFNNFFVNIGPDLAKKVPQATRPFNSYLKANFVNSFTFSPVTENEILQIVNNLNNKTSTGVDEVPLNILKEDLINISFETGYVQDELKIARVCPIFKAENKLDIGNYRPISVLPASSKIYEKAMQTRLLNYIRSNNILIDKQYGF